MTALTSRSRLAAAVSPLALRMRCVAGSAAGMGARHASRRPIRAAPASNRGATATPAADQAKPTATPEGAIVVTGFRASLQSAINKKKRADQIVESVSAEDIGKLPDASIGESIARLPGLAVAALTGRADVISIRGFGPDFSTHLLNGREQTSTGDNRAVEYRPVSVRNHQPGQRLQDAAGVGLVGQGLAGTVDLRTIRPLEFGKRVIAVGGRAVYADLGKLNAGRQEVGLSRERRLRRPVRRRHASASRSPRAGPTSHIRSKEFNAWGYADGPAAGKVVIGGLKSYSTLDPAEAPRPRRDDRIQAEPTRSRRRSTPSIPTSRTTRSSAASRSRCSGARATLPARLHRPRMAWSPPELSPTLKDVVRNVANRATPSSIRSAGTTATTATAAGTASFDISYSKTNRNELVFETYAGTGYAGSGPRDTFGFRDERDGTDHYQPRPRLFGSEPDLHHQIRRAGAALIQSPVRQAGYYNNRIVHDRIWQVHAEVSKEFDGSFLSQIRVGGITPITRKSLTPDEVFVQLTGTTTSLQIRLPDEFQLGSGRSRLARPRAQPGLRSERLARRRHLHAGAEHPLDVVVKAYHDPGKARHALRPGQYRRRLGSAQLTGNVGVQAVHTDQSSNGFTADRSTNGADHAITGRREILGRDAQPEPSLRFPSDFVIRLGLAREVMRPRIDDMRAAFRYGGNVLNVGRA